MIEIDKEFYSKPYYFFLKEKANDFNLYFSIEKNLTEARKKDVMVKVPKDKVEMVKKYIKSLTSKKNGIFNHFEATTPGKAIVNGVLVANITSPLILIA